MQPPETGEKPCLYSKTGRAAKPQSGEAASQGVKLPWLAATSRERKVQFPKLKERDVVKEPLGQSGLHNSL